MSLNKAAKSSARTYRERHQPGDRGHLGLLEKRKDYRLRAKDYNEKKEILKHLRQKVSSIQFCRIMKRAIRRSEP